MHVRNGPDRELRWERHMELPLLVGSLVFLGCYAVLVLAPDTRPAWRGLALAGVLLMWAVFLVDYVVRLVLSGLGTHFPRKHWLDTVVLVLPLLRPLRIVTTYTTIQRRRNRPQFSLYGRVMAYAGLSALLLGFAAALAVYQQERGAPGATIRTFGDSVWWAASAITTVGYGDVTPVTPWGRVFAVGLMGCGLALLGAVTGSFSSWLIQTFGREDAARGVVGTDSERPPEG
jgi:voltage-gated potassium channel